LRTNFRNTKILEHTNTDPQKVNCSFFVQQDRTVAKIVYRHIIVTKPQLLKLMVMAKLPFGQNRITKLVKYGFLNRYKAFDGHGKVCEHFFTIGPKAADQLECPLPLLPEPGVATSILATNQFIIAFLLNHGGFTYQITPKAPATGYVQVRSDIYTLFAPSDEKEAVACAEHMNKASISKAIAILPNHTLVNLIKESAPGLVFYAFDTETIQLHAKLFREDYGTLRVSNFSLGRAQLNP